jgi:hypothetical protein
MFYVSISEGINYNEKISLDDALNDFLDKKYVTEDGITAIKDINNIVETSSDILSQIAAIRDGILNSTMSVEEQRIPLIYASVAYHSADFGIKNADLLYGKPWPWKVDADAAIKGFASGAVIGALTGTGPFGIVAGAVNGFIGSGIGASLVAWIKSLLP